jgi:hypothetical protein
MQNKPFSKLKKKRNGFEFENIVPIPYVNGRIIMMK